MNLVAKIGELDARLKELRADVDRISKISWQEVYVRDGIRRNSEKMLKNLGRIYVFSNDLYHVNKWRKNLFFIHHLSERLESTGEFPTKDMLRYEMWERSERENCRRYVDMAIVSKPDLISFRDDPYEFERMADSYVDMLADNVSRTGHATVLEIERMLDDAGFKYVGQ